MFSRCSGVAVSFCRRVFRGLNLDGQCEPIQVEIDTLEACADEVQAAVNQQKATCKCLKRDLARLDKDESSISADVEELTQALHDDVRNACFCSCSLPFHLLFYFWRICIIFLHILVAFFIMKLLLLFLVLAY